MKRNILKLAMVVALFTGFVVAQNPSSQSQPDQSQQMPQTTQSQTQAAGSVQSQIPQQPELSGVTVNESSNKIELSGTVASKADKQKAKSIAESNAAGRKVVDNIKVSSRTSTPSTTQPPR